MKLWCAALVILLSGCGCLVIGIFRIRDLTKNPGFYPFLSPLAGALIAIGVVLLVKAAIGGE